MLAVPGTVEYTVRVGGQTKCCLSPGLLNTIVFLQFLVLTAVVLYYACWFLSLLTYHIRYIVLVTSIALCDFIYFRSVLFFDRNS